MEGSLGGARDNSAVCIYLVLILVIMENTLGVTYKDFQNLAHCRS